MVRRRQWPVTLNFLGCIEYQGENCSSLNSDGLILYSLTCPATSDRRDQDATRSDDRLNASPVRHLQPKLSAVRAQLGWSIHHTCRHMWIVHISQTQDYAHHIHVRGDASTSAAGCIFFYIVQLEDGYLYVYMSKVSSMF